MDIGSADAHRSGLDQDLARPSRGDRSVFDPEVVPAVEHGAETGHGVPAGIRLLASPWAARPTAADSADIIDQVTFIIGADDVSLSAAAQLVGMSESALSRYFSRTVGHSFSDTVRRMRLARACQSC